MQGLRLKLMLVAAALFAAPSAMGQNAPAAASAPGLALGRPVMGDLTPSDAQRHSGKYEDSFTIEGRRGDRVQLDLASTDFDAYLVVTGPGAFTIANDDAAGGGDSTDSRLVLQLPADGAYRVAVTSFRPGETGAYRLAAATPAANMAVTAPLAAQPIAIGATVAGTLANGDGRAADGSFTDHYRFVGRRGQRVTVSLSSTDFDTYLFLARPDGSQDSNDDTRAEGHVLTDSRMDTVLAEDGDYLITVSSYRPDATGKYRLSLATSAGDPRQVRVQGGARVVALLVGVSDYGGRTSNLPNTDADAQELYNSLRSAGLLHPASRVLTNADATSKNVAQAFAQAAAAAGPNDIFLFFFSGHGDQVDVPVSAAELDGRAETIELYDTAMTDAQIAPLFARVHARLSVVALDACFAGGFRNLIDRPNVMGLFSSEEDLTSLVASRFKAGGFLSYFLRAGLSGEADDDGDRIVTAGELSTYVRRRFRREGDIPATTREDDRNYQNLLIERGGVNVEDVVVRLASANPNVAPLVQRQAPVQVQPLPVGDAKQVKRPKP
jgi:Caspase domain/Bacterial pre-peptidase C-terminal domain